MHKFENDDAGYLKWVENHPVGLVVTSHRKPQAGELVLHKTSCYWIRDPRQRPGAWTHRDYIKSCGEDLSELERWARDETGEGLRACKHCRPI